jgi:hypothetical protein
MATHAPPPSLLAVGDLSACALEPSLSPLWLRWQAGATDTTAADRPRRDEPAIQSAATSTCPLPDTFPASPAAFAAAAQRSESLRLAMAAGCVDASGERGPAAAASQLLECAAAVPAPASSVRVRNGCIGALVAAAAAATTATATAAATEPGERVRAALCTCARAGVRGVYVGVWVCGWLGGWVAGWMCECACVCVLVVD